MRNNIICASLYILTGVWHTWGGGKYNKHSITVVVGKYVCTPDLMLDEVEGACGTCGRYRNSYKNLKLNERDHLGDTSIDGRIILKLTLKKGDWMNETGFVWFS